MHSSNPSLGAFESLAGQANQSTGVMTIDGTVNKSFIMLAILTASAGYTWYHMTTGTGSGLALLVLGLIGGFITALITIFRPSSSPYTAPLYAILEGLVLGAVSQLMDAVYPGIVMQAVMLTMGVFFLMLMAYKTGFIQANEQFRTIIFIATASIAFVYLISFILRFFGTDIPMIHANGWVGIVFSLIVVGVASLNLIIDFDDIKQFSDAQLPKYMEWYASFSLMLTLVWLYLEILRLLSKLRSD